MYYHRTPIHSDNTPCTQLNENTPCTQLKRSRLSSLDSMHYKYPDVEAEEKRFNLARVLAEARAEQGQTSTADGLVELFEDLRMKNEPLP